MAHKESKKAFGLYIWELALLTALCLALLAGAWAGARQARLSAGLIRLHVIAADDSAAEQAVKLRVRDAVLAFLSPQLENAASAGEAAAVVASALPELEAAAAEAAEGRAVTVTLTQEYYPTRDYGDFSLPAGRYESLRVILDEGTGRNWWCVVFPPLCLQEDTGAALEAMEELSPGDAALITREDEGYEVRFRLLELWGELCRWAEDVLPGS